MSKWIAEFDLEDGDTMPEHMDLEYKGVKLDFHCRPMWIPVTERLPEDAYPVIVTWKNDDPKSYYQYILGKHYTGVAHFKNGIWYWYSSTTEDVLMEYGRCDSDEFDEAIQVLAWQPLPTPYREGGQDEQN